MKRSRSGFTLIELLTVIGLIAVFSVVLGLALGRGNSGAALQSSQATLQGLFASARGQAAINQGDAYVVVNVDPQSEGFLREFHVALAVRAVGSPIGSPIDSYRAVGSPVTLSQGVYLVPRTTAHTYGGVLSFDGYNLSTAFSESGTNGMTDIDGLSGRYAIVNGMTSRGTSIGGGQIVLAPAERRSPDSWVFTNPDAVRGVSISHYGVLTFLNDRESMQ